MFRASGYAPPAPASLAVGRQALSLAEAIRCFAKEYIAVFRMFNWLQPFCSHRPCAQPAKTIAAGQASLCCSCTAMPATMRCGSTCNPHWRLQGYRCEAIDMEPVLGDIDAYAEALLSRIEQMVASTGQAPLLVCHSMGGLVARGSGKGAHDLCAGVVTLGTPHHGCALAASVSGAMPGKCAAAARGSRRHWPPPRHRLRARLVSVFSWHDLDRRPVVHQLAGRSAAYATVGHRARIAAA
ncbi:esterase/lipase family protein [Cupriavidus basilensis]